MRDRVDRIIKRNLLADYVAGQRKLANSDSVNEPDILTPASRNVHETTEGEPLNDEQMIDENERGQDNNTPIYTEQDSYMPTNAEAASRQVKRTSFMGNCGRMGGRHLR